MKKIIMILAVLAAALSLAPTASAHEAEEARTEHFLGVNWDSPWLSRAFVIGGLAAVGVAVYAIQRR